MADNEYEGTGSMRAPRPEPTETRWTVAAGRQLYFDGRPALSLGREGETLPVEADNAVKFVAEALNRAGMTLDELYRRQMGNPKPRREEGSR